MAMIGTSQTSDLGTIQSHVSERFRAKVRRAQKREHAPDIFSYATRSHGAIETARCDKCQEVGGYDHGSHRGWGWDTECQA